MNAKMHNVFFPAAASVNLGQGKEGKKEETIMELAKAQLTGNCELSELLAAQ